MPSAARHLYMNVSSQCPKPGKFTEFTNIFKKSSDVRGLLPSPFSTSEKSPAGSCWLHVFLSSMSLMSADVILRAADRIKPFVRRTPLEISYWLSEAGNARVYVKLGECHDLISKAFGCDHRRLGEFRSSLVRIQGM